MPSDNQAAYGLLFPALLVLFALMVVPLAALLALSFWRQEGFTLLREFSLDNYRFIFALSPEPRYLGAIPFPFENPIYLMLAVKSVLMSALATAAVVLLAYPMAYFLAFRTHQHKFIWLIVVTIPFWTSYLLRLYAWKIMLGGNGVVNASLMNLGVLTEPLGFLLYNPFAVVIVLAHSWAAFAILPIYVSLEKIDRSLLEAAANLGDGPWQRFRSITLPLSRPGIVAAVLLVFIPTVGDYFTPQVVGGTSGMMIGNIVQSLFTRTNNAPLGAAVSIVTMAIVTLVATGFVALAADRRKRPGGRDDAVAA
ncbi:MAG TPA: ABC transporter permease [Mesorhizobium sp.]|nr:ABC transporter permease [Mesorhizobium sp.]